MCVTETRTLLSAKDRAGLVNALKVCDFSFSFFVLFYVSPPIEAFDFGLQNKLQDWLGSTWTHGDFATQSVEARRGAMGYSGFW